MAEQSRRSLLRRKQAAEYLTEHWFDVSPKTLATIASRGSDGPPFQKRGRFPLYTTAALDEWAHSKLSKPVRSNAELRGLSR